ncbi:unnamed protein product [Calicophoron daubneyi]|uniref:Uncharacterized protein n=1 Tax=Calicophoron daubneyi TaxID=300641 RepID=A0AAV2TC40_CALDB
MTETRRIVLTKGAHGYGFSLKTDARLNSNTAVIDEVEPGGAADRAGLTVGQQICSINGISLPSVSPADIADLISGTNEVLEVTILEAASEDSFKPNLGGGVESVDADNRQNDTVPSERSEQETSWLSKPIPKPRLSRRFFQPIPSHKFSRPDEQIASLNSGTSRDRDNLSARIIDDATEGVTEAAETSTMQPPNSSHSSLSDSKSKALLALAENAPEHDTTLKSEEEEKERDRPDKNISNTQLDREISSVEDTQNWIQRNGRSSILRSSLENEDILRPVRFVRKRAYASARQASHFDQFAGPMPDATWLTGLPNPGNLLNADSVASSIQLLPAVSKNSPPPASIVEPKINRLPRRRSTKGASHPTRPPQKLYERNDHNVVHSSHSTPDHALGNCDQPTDRLPAKLAATTAAGGVPLPPRHDTGPSNDSSSFPAKSGLSGAPFWSSFDNERDDDLWTRAGEAYQWIDYATREIARKHAANRQRQIGAQLENQGAMERSIRELNLGSNGLTSETTGSQKHLQPHSSPLVRPNTRSTHGPLTSMTSADSVSGGTQGTNARRPYLRNWCTAIRHHRSESNIHCDTGRSFLSRQCLCRILAVDNTDTKSRPWKPFYMSISGSEVRFLKASSAFCSSGRLAKVSKSSLKSAGKSNSVMPNSKETAGGMDSSVDSSHSYVNTTPQRKDTMTTGAAPDDAFLPKSNSSDLVSVTSSSCLILPIPGLVWRREPLPKDLPHWVPLGPLPRPPTSGTQQSSYATSDRLDPQISGLSKPEDLTLSPGPLPNSYHSTDPGCDSSSTKENMGVTASLRCYRFAHLGAGVELLFVFPDENSATACLNMCEVSGGREAAGYSVKEQMNLKLDALGLISSAPSCYDLFFIKNHPKMSTQSEKVSTPLQSSARWLFDQDITDNPALSPVNTGPIKLKDRRHRRVENQSSMKESDGLISVAESHSEMAANIRTCVPTLDSDGVKSRKKDRGPGNGSGTTSVSDTRQLSPVPGAESDVVPLSPDDKSSTTDSHRSQPSKSRGAPFLRGIKQWLNRPLAVSSGSSASNEQASPSPTSSPGLDMKLSAVFGEPPDFSEFDSPGPVFGAPLEKQIQSPDYPFVPVMLEAFILALETYGLDVPGLYRKPGRHRTISQFVCTCNLDPLNIDLLLKLDAWREMNVLCGLVKHFLRRLPVGLFSLSAWDPLASLVPADESRVDTEQLAYLLLSIRVQLKKMAKEACRTNSGSATSNELTSIWNAHKNAFTPNAPPSSSAVIPSTYTLQNSVENRSQSPPVDPVPLSPPNSRLEPPNPSGDGVDSNSVARWRWATLCYLVRHIRNVVACRSKNEVSYQCIAICFGPVFFGDSPNLPKLNGVLEQLFRHWNWLIEGLPTIGKGSTMEFAASGSLPAHDFTLSEAVDHLKQFSDSVDASSSDLVSSSGGSDIVESLDDGVGPLGRDDSPLNGKSSRSESNLESQRSTSATTTAQTYEEVCLCVRALFVRTLETVDLSELDLQMENNNSGSSSQNGPSVPSFLHRVVSAVPRSSKIGSSSLNSSHRRRLTVDTMSSRSHGPPTLLDRVTTERNRAGWLDQRGQQSQDNPSQSASLRAVLDNPDEMLEQHSPLTSQIRQTRADGVIPRPIAPSSNRTYVPDIPLSKSSSYKL